MEPMVFGIKIVDFIYGIAIILLSAFIAREKLKEVRLSKRYKLLDNPERCARHETKIERLEIDFKQLSTENKEAHEKILSRLDSLDVKIAKLEERLFDREGRSND